MAAKRGKVGVPPAAGTMGPSVSVGVGVGVGGIPRSELRVYRAGSSDGGRLPVPTNLRKQRSLTNLAVLTDAEKKMQLYEPKWCDDMAKPGSAGTPAGRHGKPKTLGGGGGGIGCAGAGGSQLSRNLSKSEHSLFQGKPKPFGALAPPAGKVQSRIPRGPYAEVKPLSKASEDAGKSDDDLLSAKAKAAAHANAAGTKKGASVAGGDAEGKGQGEENGGDKGFLKVDPELVVTVLGDLEQLLFSQMLDPESQRKRTVQNVLDLRQNLEDTMSSLRGTQLSHSVLEGSVCYDSDETNARSLSSLSNRSSPLSWRHGQSSPRLQAGDAPSSAGGHGIPGGRGQFTSHTMPTPRSSSRLSHSQLELMEGLDDHLKSGYLSDSDLLSKSLHDDDDDDDVNLANGWDESSSISSGLSDGSDNLSLEDLNASSSLNSLPTTPTASRRNSSVMLRTDAEKRSLVESGLAWYSEEGKVGRKLEGGGAYDTGSLKAEPTCRWRKSSKPLDGATGAGGVVSSKELKKPQSLGHPGGGGGGGGGGGKKTRNPPVGVTSPITHSSHNVLKVAALPKSEPRVGDKGKMMMKGAGLQRSCSDAGRDRGLGEHRKPPSGLVRPSAAGSYGYKKPTPTTGTATVLTAGGATISSGSATVGKMPKSSGIPIKPLASGGRKNSFDASSCHETGSFLAGARNSLQYRSLPRPAKSSAMSLTGRPASRPPSGAMDTSLMALKPVPSPGSISGSGSMGRPGSATKVRSSSTSCTGSGSGPVNQTDREKEKERAKAKADLLEMKAELQEGGGDSISKVTGVRRASAGSKYHELASPSTHRVLSSKSVDRAPLLSQVDKLSPGSLDTCVSIQDLPPKIPPFSKLRDLAGSSSSSTFSPSPSSGPGLSPRLTPSPAPMLHIDSPGCFSGTSLSLSGSPLLYPRMSALHRSMETLPLHMSLAPPTNDAANLSPRQHDDAKASGTWGASSSSRTSITLTDSLQTDRSTLPKKGFSRYDSPPSGEPRERRHSHNVVSTTDSDSPPMLPSPTHIPHTLSGRTPPTNIVAPIPVVGGASRITRSNSIPANEGGSYELYGSAPLGSPASLTESRPKSMMRSGSFREPGEDVHGSILSLASNASSNYSSTEERVQGEQIRKLRRELECSQEKVANLTNQLSENANLVAAFEQSLALMTSRLNSLTVTSDQKDNELGDLKETIEVLKVKNTEAQSIIQDALNTPTDTHTPPEPHINRQNSLESLASVTSVSSHSSMGSLKEQDPKKKKKKSWLRSSFNKAFSKKGSKLSASYADIEEITTPESSAPSSPKVFHGPPNEPPCSLPPTTTTTTTTGVCGGGGGGVEGGEGGDPGEEKVVTELRSELWEKERKLTDIRLEALNSAHQLEQLRDAMTNMQATVEKLKAENDQLKTGGPSRPPSSTSQSSGLMSLASLSPRQSVVATLPKTFNTSMGESGASECVSDSVGGTLQKDESLVRLVVRIPDQHIFKEEVRQQDFLIGVERISPRTDWMSLDKAIGQAFKDYLSVVDASSSLGLSVDSVLSYNIGHLRRVMVGVEPPETLPFRSLATPPSSILITLKGLHEKCVDTLVFETLVPKTMMQHYISLLLKHRRLLLSGPSGTGKTHLAQRLTHYLVQRSGRPPSHTLAVTFNMHRQSCKDLQLYLSNLANQIDRETGQEIPLVVILDDVHDPASISELVNGALTCKYHKCPYIIGTTNQPVKMTPNHGLHLSFRMVTFSNNVEPANGFLGRYLHRKLVESEEPGGRGQAREEVMRVLDWVPQLWYHLHAFLEKHSTSDFLIGPCFFLSCPVTVEDFRSWFIDLWNHSIIPYLQEGAKDGIKVHGQQAVWEDPVEWVRGTLPWPRAQQDQAKLFHLPPPATTARSPGQPTADARTRKDTPPSSADTDPLMAMLLKLQEAANHIESPDKDLDPKLPAL